jgi:hypothetical protein
VGSPTDPILTSPTYSPKRSPSVIRATSASVNGSSVFGFLTVSKRSSSLPDMPLDSSASPEGRAGRCVAFNN